MVPSTLVFTLYLANETENSGVKISNEIYQRSEEDKRKTAVGRLSNTNRCKIKLPTALLTGRLFHLNAKLN